MITKFNTYNESVRDILQPISEDEIKNKINNLSIPDKILIINQYDLSKKLLPTEEEIDEYINKHIEDENIKEIVSEYFVGSIEVLPFILKFINTFPNENVFNKLYVKHIKSKLLNPSNIYTDEEYIKKLGEWNYKISFLENKLKTNIGYKPFENFMYIYWSTFWKELQNTSWGNNTVNESVSDFLKGKSDEEVKKQLEIILYELSNLAIENGLYGIEDYDIAHKYFSKYKDEIIGWASEGKIAIRIYFRIINRHGNTLNENTY